MDRSCSLFALVYHEVILVQRACRLRDTLCGCIESVGGADSYRGAWPGDRGGSERDTVSAVSLGGENHRNEYLQLSDCSDVWTNQHQAQHEAALCETLLGVTKEMANVP